MCPVFRRYEVDPKLRDGCLSSLVLLQPEGVSTKTSGRSRSMIAFLIWELDQLDFFADLIARCIRDFCRAATFL